MSARLTLTINDVHPTWVTSTTSSSNKMTIHTTSPTKVLPIVLLLHTPLLFLLTPMSTTSAFLRNRVSMSLVPWSTKGVVLAVNLQREVNGPLFCVKAVARSGRIRHYWIGMFVSVAPHERQSLNWTIFQAWFRLFVGDLSNDVSDDVLSNAFNKYESFRKARVIRDRLSQKVTRGGTQFCIVYWWHCCRQNTDSWLSLTQKIFSRRGKKWMVRFKCPFSWVL